MTGPTSNSLSYQSGGWTVDWQGSPSDSIFTYGTTVVEAAKTVTSWQVTTSCGVSILGEKCDDEDGASPAALATADFVLVCIGEENYTEKPGDIRDARLARGQIDYVQRVKSETSGKVVLVYFGGRPRLLNGAAGVADAVFIAFLPGPDGGRAVIDLITGVSNPSGRLPITYPQYSDGGGAPYYSAVSDQCTVGAGTLPHWDNKRCISQWSFGRGLSYTNFEYTDLLISSDEIQFIPGAPAKADRIKVSATVRNTGPLPGADVVLFFLFDDTRYVTPEYKRLRYFEKVMLQSGEDRKVTWDITLDDFYHIGPHDDTHLVLQEGAKVRIGVGPDTDCRENSGDPLCSPPIQLQLSNGRHYVGACDAACHIWSGTGCSMFYGMDWDSCWKMCTDIAKENYKLHGRHEGWGWNYVECIESVSRGFNVMGAGVVQQDAACRKMTEMCRDVFHTPLLDEYGESAIDGDAADPIVGVGIAFLAGIVATISILSLFRKRGGLEKKRPHGDGDVEFAPLENGRSGEEAKVV